MDLKNTPFDHCSIRENIFKNTNLSGSDFSGSDLRGSMFHNSDLTKVDFRKAKDFSINPLTNKLQKARFNRYEAVSLLAYLDIILD
jgi:uncharacterized protein YjbI with pentapeptide repeats